MKKITHILLTSLVSVSLTSSVTWAALDPSASDYENVDQENEQEESPFYEVIEGTSLIVNGQEIFIDAGDQITFDEILVNELDESEREVKFRVLKRNGEVQSYQLDETALAQALTSSEVPAHQIATSLEQILGQEVAGQWIAPVKGRISSRPGPRKRHPVTGKRSYHYGTDYAVPTGTSIKAASTGTVSFAGTAGGYGKLVELVHPGGWITRYAHLSTINVRCGTVVNVGSIVGKSGATGRVTGPHLHFEKRQRPPKNGCGVSSHSSRGRPSSTNNNSDNKRSFVKSLR